MSLVLKLSKCRLCLKLGDFYSIFATDNAIQLANMAMACSNIEIYEGDGLPDKICGECIEKLSSSYIFKQQCERSDAELRKTLQIPSEISPYGRRNSDSGFSNRTDGSSSKKDAQQPARPGRSKPKDLSSPDKPNFLVSEATLLKESYSVDTVSTYEGMQVQPLQHFSKTRSSDSRSNSPATSELAKFQCKKCNRTYTSSKSLRVHTCKVILGSKGEDAEDVSSQDSFKIVKMETLAEPTGDKELKCPDCGQTFRYNIMLKRHQLICKATSQVVIAQTAGETSTTTKQRKNKFSLPAGSLRCPVCSKLFKKRIYVYKHLRNTSCGSGGSKSLAGGAMLVAAKPNSRIPMSNAIVAECSICSSRFSSHMLMFKHFQLCYKRRGPAPVVCKTCNTTYTRITGLYKHIRSRHMDTKKFVPAGSGLLRPKIEPVSSDEQTPKLKCRECEKTFDDQGQLVMHLAAHMANIVEPKKGSAAKTTMLPNQRPEFECKECFKKFKYKASYRGHLRTVHDFSEEDLRSMDTELVHECEVCNRTFTSTKSLKYHKAAAHSSGTPALSSGVSTEYISYSSCPMRCLLCDVIVTGTIQDKKKHNLIHINKNEKPKNEYECPACLEKFTNTRYFGVHIAQHNNESNAKPRPSQEPSLANDDAEEESMHEGTEDHYDNDNNEEFNNENDNDINAMDFCESVVANIKQEANDSEMVNECTSSYAIQTQKLVIALGGITCVVCNASVHTYTAYQEHMKSHVEKEETENMKLKKEDTQTTNTMKKCNVCDAEFKLAILYKRHLKEHIEAAKEDPSILNCKECGRENKNYRAFAAHYNWHVSMRELKCHICLKVFNKRSTLMRHFTIKHTNRAQILDPIEEQTSDNKVTPFQCHLCNKYLLTAVSLKCHVQWHNSRSAQRLNRYPCHQCTLVFSSKLRYKLHMRKHNVVTPFKCSTCGLYLISKTKLMQHEKGHRGGKKGMKKYKCPICERQFLHVVKLQGHLRRQHPESKMVKKKDPGAEDLPKIKFVCKVCGREFETQARLNTHTESHNRRHEFFVCTLCGRRNASRKAHTLHIKSHMNQKFKENPLPCPHCDKVFVRRRLLHVHMYEAHDILETYTLTTTENRDNKTDSLKEYQCQVCFKLLASEGNYLRHIDFHNSLRCNYCLKHFTKASFLEAHCKYDCDRKKVLNSSDSFEKKLKCSDCYKAFSIPIKLRCHLHVQHNKDLKVKDYAKEELIVCDFCFSSYSTQEQMEKHKQSHIRHIDIWGCKRCPKKFSSMKAFRRHMLTHKHLYYTDNPLQCEECTETFIYFQDYSDHMETVHEKAVDWLVLPTKSPTEECHICKKTFPRLHRHLLFHEKYYCKDCNEHFMADYLYEKHRLSTHGSDEEVVRPLPVRERSKGAAPDTMHFYNIPIEPYTECKFCYKPFTTWNTEGSHRRNHKTLKSFGCELCDKTFGSLTSFEMHMPSHRFKHYKQNPLLCKHCGQTFIKYGLYIRHLKVEHNEKATFILRPKYPVEECKICKEKFENIHFHYRFHMKLHCKVCNRYILSEKMFRNHTCNDLNRDESMFIEYNEDITELAEGKFDYSTLRHRPIDKLDDSVPSTTKDLPNIDVTEMDLSNSDLPERDTSSQSSQDKNVFKPVISSTISLSNINLGSDDDITMEGMDDDSQNAQTGLDTSMIESTAEILKIVDDLENSFSGAINKNNSTDSVVELD